MSRLNLPSDRDAADAAALRAAADVIDRRLAESGKRAVLLEAAARAQRKWAFQLDARRHAQMQEEPR